MEGTHKTILLADDEDRMRAAVAQALEHGGYAVLPARNGEHALEVFRTSRQGIHALVTDFAMGRMNGLQLIKEIRSFCPHLPSLLITGTPRDLLVCASAADDVPLPEVLEKPFSGDSLRAAVAKILSAA